MNSSPEIVSWYDNRTGVVTKLEAVRLPYSKITSIDPENRIKNVDSYLLSQLRLIVLPELDNTKNNLHVIQQSRFAFECANALTSDLSYDFCQPYYKQIIKPLLEALSQHSLDYEDLRKLNEYMGAEELSDTIGILRTIVLCLTESTIDLTIFREASSATWRRELLLRALLSNDHSWNLTLAQKIVEKIDTTIDLMRQQNRNFCIENVLEYLLSNQRRHHLDLEFLIDVLDFVSREQNDCLVKYITNIPIVVRNDQNQMQAVTLDLLDLREIMKEFRIKTVEELCEGIDAEKRAEMLFFLIDYPLDTIEYLVSLIAKSSKIHLAEITDLLNLLSLTEISWLDLDELIFSLPPYNANAWKHEFISLFIEKVIANEFPSYADFLIAAKNNMEMKKESHSSNPEDYPETMYSDCDESAKADLQNWPGLNFLLNDLHAELIKFTSKADTADLEKEVGILEMLISNLDSEEKARKLITSLKILREYDTSLSYDSVCDIVKSSTAANVESRIHDFVIKVTFLRTYEKDFAQLMKELEESNKDLDLLTAFEMLLNVNDTYDNTPIKYTSCTVPIHSLTRSQIRSLPHKHYYKKNTSITLAVMTRAIYLTKGVQVRDTQMMSLILMLTSKKGKGRLAQINTGEGKTLIIAMLAACLALEGHKVDIITSSSVLAIPQSEEFRSFYALFNLSVAHNINNLGAYNSDIVYGTNLNFQGDILQSEFKKVRGRGNRRFDVAIVDEVDNMLIDGNKNLVLLSAPMPGMDQLEPLLGVVFLNVKVFASVLKEKDGVVFIDNAGLDSTDTEHQNCSDVPITETTEDFIAKNVEKILRIHLRDSGRDRSLDDKYPEIKIPNHLREFVLKVQLKNWIRTAMQAQFGLEDQQQYIIRDNVINIVDAQNTGTIQQNTTWSDGLHQFVEIKHDKRIKPESLVSNYLSNVGFFCRYKSIYGLTGTLGTEHHIDLLGEIYNVDSVIVPSFKCKQHKQLPAIIVSNEAEWYDEIVESTLSKTSNGRAVLIIMKYIEETNKLASKFRTYVGCTNLKIKLYRTEKDSRAVEEKLMSGEVIIATNLAGRGTDIKLSPDIEINGGLHVCLTHFSENSRVRDQNCGRTSRTGNSGTSQFIILDKSNRSIAELRYMYTMDEVATLEKAKTEMLKVKTKDEIFQMFCTLLGSNTTADGSLEKQAIEEQFAIWLKMHEHIIEKGCVDAYRGEYMRFEMSIIRDKKQVRNPYIKMLIGNAAWKRCAYARAHSSYNDAISLDAHSVEAAYYNRAAVSLLMRCEDKGLKIARINKAIADFAKARKIMEHKKRYMDILLRLSVKGTDLYEQSRRKIQLYDVYINSIDVAIGCDGDTLDEKIRSLEAQLSSGELTIKDRNQVYEEIERLRENGKKPGAIQTIRKDGHDVQVEFYEKSEYLDGNDHVYQQEIEEFENNGFIGPVKIVVVRKPRWYDFIVGFCIGVAQIVIGLCLTIFTDGVGIECGMRLFVEGISDCAMVIRDCLIKRDFSWAKFIFKKILNFGRLITMSALHYLGLASREVMHSAGFGNWTSMLSEWIVALLESDHQTSTTSVTVATTYVPERSLESRIEDVIIDNVQPVIDTEVIGSSVIKKMLMIDSYCNTHNWKTQIMQYAHEALKSMNSYDFRSLRSTLLSNYDGAMKLPTIANSAKKSALFAEMSKFTQNFLAKFAAPISGDECGVNQMLWKLKISPEPCVDDLRKIIAKEITRAVTKKIMNVLLHGLRPQVTHAESDEIEYDIEEHSSYKRIVSRRNRTYQKSTQPTEKAPECSNHGEYFDCTAEENIRRDREVSQNMEKVHELIQDISRNVPMNIKSLGVISDCLKHPITVWDEAMRFKYTIGESSKKSPIGIQLCSLGDQSVQHFKNPKLKCDRNNGASLLDIIGRQTGHNEDHLKQQVLNYLLNHVEETSCRIYDVARLEMYDKIQTFQKIIKPHEECFENVHFIVDRQLSLNHFCTKASMDLCHYKPFNNDVMCRLSTLSLKISRNIEIYDYENKLKYIISRVKGASNALKLKYDRDTFALMTEEDAKRLSIDIKSLNKFAKSDAYTYTFDESKMTVGFISESQEERILMHSLSLVSCDVISKLVEHCGNYNKSEILISSEELRLSPEDSYGAFWADGRIKCLWPLDGVSVILEAQGEDHCDRTNVHVQVHVIPPYF